MVAIADTGNNIVQIILEAQDNASKIIDQGSARIIQLGVAASQATQQVAGLGKAFALLASGGTISALRDATNAATLLRGAFNTPVGKQLVDSIKEVAEEAVNETKSLTEVLRSVAGGSTPLLEGLITGSEGSAARIKQKSTATAANLSRQVRETLESAVKGVGSGTGLGEDAFASLVNTGLSQGVNFGIKGFIKSQLPKELGVINDALAGGLQELALPADIKGLTQGNFFEGLEGLLTNQLGEAIENAAQKVDAASIGSADTFAVAGAKAGRVFADGFNVSGILKEEVKNQIVNNLPDIVPKGLASGALSGIFEGSTFDGVFQGLDSELKKTVKSLQAGDGEFKKAVFGGIEALDQSTEGLVSEVGLKIGARLGGAFARGLSSKALASVGEVANAIDQRILKTVSFVESLSSRLSAPLSSAGDIFGGIAGFDEPLQVFRGLQNVAGGVAEGIFTATQEIGRFAEGFQALQAFVANGPFELLIGQTVKLQEQLLATQSTLAGTNKVVQDGLTISDPTQAIQALSGPVNSAIAALRKGSLELVGVTSKDLVEAFQIVSGKAGEIGFSLQDATKLTLSFSAAMGTLGVPLFQARQEIGSILSGQIDQNSVMAKSLGLSNEMIARWKAQGTLVDQLNKRLEAFRAGNALSAQTLGGLTSNIQEIFDEIGRVAGEQLLTPILQQLQEFYGYLNQNKDALAQGIGDLVGKLLKAGEAGVSAFKALFNGLQGILSQVPDYLITSLSNAITEFAGAIATTIQILQPAINIFAELAKNALALGGPFLKLFVQFKVLDVGIKTLGNSFGILTQTLPGLGELLFALTGRSNSLVNTFASLTTAVGQGGAGFLLLGKHLNSIPGLAGAVAAKLGPIGPIAAGIIPSVAGLGIQLVGLSKQFPAVGSAMTALSAQVPGLLNNFAGIISGSNVAGGAFAAFAPSIRKTAKELAVYTQSTDLATLLNQKFADAAKQAGVAVRQQIVSFGLLAGGVFAAVYIFDNFILKNKNAIAGLERLGKKLQEIGKWLYQITGVEKIGNAIAVVVEKIADALTAIVSNPFTLAIAGATAFGIALKSGVLSPLTQVADAIKNLRFDAIQFPTEKLQSFSAQLGNLLAIDTGKGAATKQAAALQDSLKATADQYRQAIADRKAQIAQLDSQVASAQGSDGQISPFVDVEGIQERRKALTQEIEEIKTARKQQGQELAGLRKEAVQAVTPPSIRQRVTGTGTQIKGGTASLAGSGVAALGEAIASAGFEGLGDRLGKSSEKMKEFGQKALESASAQNGFLNNAKLTNASLDGFGGTLKRAGGSMAGFVGSIVAATGPIVLLTAAIAAVTEALTIYGEITNAGEQPLKDYNSSLEEQRGKLEEILRLQGKINDLKPGGDKTKSPEERAREKIRSEEGFVTKALDFFGKGGIAGVGFEQVTGNKLPTAFGNAREDAVFNASVEGSSKFIESARKDADQYKASLKTINSLQDDIAKQRRRRSELDTTRASIAAGGGDTQAIENQIKQSDASIKRAEDEIQARKALADETIKAVEKQEAPTQNLKAAQAQLLTQLKEIRGEMEAIGNTKILPQDLPRRGTTFEQLQSKAAQAESTITKTGGDQAQFDAQTKEFLSTTRQQLELSQITEQEAIRRAKIVAESDRAQVADQIEAQKLIADAFKSSGEERQVILEKQTAEIEKQVAEGVLTEEEGAVRITEVKRRELDKQLGDLAGQRGEEVAREKDATEQILKELDRRAAEAKLRLAQARGDKGATEAAAAELVNQLLPKKEDLARQAGEVEAEVNRLKAATGPGKNASPEDERRLSTAQAKLEELRRGIADTEKKIEEVNQSKSAPGKTDKAAAGAAQAEIEQLAKDREAAIAASNNRVTELNNRFDTQEAKNRTEAAKEARQQVETTYKDSLSKVQAEELSAQNEIEQKKREGKISSAEADKQLFDAAKQRIADEIKLEEDKVKQLSGQKGREKDVAEAQKRILELRKQGTKAEEDFNKAKLDRIQADETKAQFEIAKLRESGAITGEEAEKRLAAASSKRIAEEIKLEEEKLAKLSGKKGGEKEVAESQKRILDLKKQAADAEIKEIERVQQKAIDLSRESEAKRQIAIQQLENSGAITKVKAEGLRGQATKKRIDEELKAEQQKLKALENAKNKDERAIRASRLRTLDLTRQSLEEEKKAQEQVTKELRDDFERRIKAQAEVNEQRQIQPLQEQLRLYDLINQALDFRSKLIKASQDLGNAASDYLQQEFQILSEGETSDRKKKEIAQATAAIKLQTAREQIALETEVFKIQQEQKRIALERRDIENQIAIAKKQAEIVKGEGELAIARQQLKTGEISKEQFAAVALEQRGRTLELGALQKERGLIQREKALQPLLEQAEGAKFQLDQRKKLRGAEMDFANAAPNAGERRRRVRELGDREARDQGFGNRQEFIDDLIQRSRGAAEATFSKGGDRGQDALKGLSDRFTPQGVRNIQGKLSQGDASVQDFIQQQRQDFIGQRSLLPGGREQIPTGLSGDLSKILPGLGRGDTGFGGGAVGPSRPDTARQEKVPTGEQVINFQPNIYNNVEINASGLKGSAVDMRKTILQELDQVTKKAERLATNTFKKSA